MQACRLGKLIENKSKPLSNKLQNTSNIDTQKEGILSNSKSNPTQRQDTEKNGPTDLGHTSLPTVTAGHTGDDSNICRELKKTLQ